MRIFKFFLLLLFLSFYSLSPPALAAPLNDQDAARLKAIFEKPILDQQELTKAADGVRMDVEGDVLVEKADGYYAITFPSIKIHYPDNSYMDLGILSINAAPHENSSQWKLTVALPKAFMLYDANNQFMGSLTIGSQKIAGLWDEGFNGFVELDAQLGDLVMSLKKTTNNFKIEAIKIRHKFSAEPAPEEGRWSGPGYLTAENIYMGEEESAAFKLGQLKLDYSLDRYNPSLMQQYRETLTEYMQNQPANDDAGQTLALTKAFYEMISGLMDGFKFSYQFSDLDMALSPRTTSPSADQESGDISQIKLDRGQFGFQMDGALGQSMQADMMVDFYGLSANPMQVEYAPLMPEFGAAALKIKNLPVRSLSEVMKNTLEGAAKNPETAQLMGLSLMLKLPALLSESKTAIALENTAFGNDTYNVSSEIEARAAITAANGAVMDGEILIMGLDALLQHVTEVGGREDYGDAQNFRKIAAALGHLKEYAVEESRDNKALHVLKLEMNEQGQVLINEQEWGSKESSIDPSMIMPGMPGAPNMGLPAK